MGLFGRKPEPLKDGLHDPQPWELPSEAVIEINELHDTARRATHSGDKAVEMIFEDHRNQKIRAWYQSKLGGVLRYDPKTDRWHE